MTSTEYKILIKQWIVIYKMVKTEDISLRNLRKLCIENKVDINKCYKHYLKINNISQEKAKNLSVSYIEKYMKLLHVKEQYDMNNLSSYELEVGHILCRLKNNTIY